MRAYITNIFNKLTILVHLVVFCPMSLLDALLIIMNSNGNILCVWRANQMKKQTTTNELKSKIVEHK